MISMDGLTFFCNKYVIFIHGLECRICAICRADYILIGLVAGAQADYIAFVPVRLGCISIVYQCRSCGSRKGCGNIDLCMIVTSGIQYFILAGNSCEE